MVANASGYFFHLALGRILSPAEYGTLGVLLAIFTIVTVPVTAIQNTAAKLFSRLQKKPTEINYILQRVGPSLTKLSWIVFLIFFLFSLFTYQLFNLPSAVGLTLIGFSIIFIFHLAWNRGVMQGLFDFNNLSFNYSVEGLVKLLFGVTLGYLFLQAQYAIFGITLAFLAAYWFSTHFINQHNQASRPHKKTAVMNNQYLVEGLRMTAGTLGVLFFISVDLIFAKKFLSEYDSGFYTALSTLGKVAFFAPLSIATAFFPYASKEANVGKRFHLLISAFLLVLITVLGVVALYLLFPQQIFDFLFAGKYGQVGSLLAVMGVAIGVVGIVQLIINYLLSQSGWLFAWAMLFSGIFQITAYLLFHASVTQFVSMTLASAVFMLFLSGWTLVQKEKL